MSLSPDQITGAAPLPPPQQTPKIALVVDLAAVELAEHIAKALPPGALYLYHDEYVTVDPDGTVTPMTANAFVTWIAKFVYFYKKDGRRKKEEEQAMQKAGEDLRRIYGQQRNISPNTAAVILASRELREVTPVLERINPTRLLVAYEQKGRRSYGPAKIGYDPRTKAFTLDSLPIDWSRVHPREYCFRRLWTIFREFPFDGGKHPAESHSLAAAVTALLGTLLHDTFETYPLVMVNAGQPSTGKSFLVKSILAPVHGRVHPTNPSRDENEFRKTLNATLFCGDDYCWLDDIETLRSNHLNRFITEPVIQDRLMGEGKTFVMPNRMQFYATGNEVETSIDIEPRTLYIDLFTAEDASHRKFSGELSDEVILSPEWRREVLTLLWSLVQGYVRAGSPVTDATPAGRFPQYTVCARIARWAGFGDAFGPRQIELDTGDVSQHALIDLIIHMADQIGYTCLVRGDEERLDPFRPGETHTGAAWSWSTTEIVETAQAYQNIIETILPNPRQLNNPAQSLGQKIKKVRGRLFTDSYGRKFLFGDRKRSARSSYTIQILSEPLADTPRER